MFKLFPLFHQVVGLYRYQLWQKKIQQHPYATSAVVVLVVILFIFLAYWFSWNWTGFNGADKTDKTLYDWLQLLFVPAALTGFGFFLNYRERKSEERRIDKERQEEERRAEHERKLEQQHDQTRHDIAKDNQCEEALQAYINEMSELLLHKNLRDPKEGGEIRSIARVRTITVLSRLNSERKKIVLLFLHESGLILKDKPIIDLRGANLYKINLSHFNLSDAELSGAILRRATLGGANLIKTDLWGADFTTTIGGFEDLSTIGSGEYLVLDSADGGVMANLRGANLSEAILYGSNATPEQLDQAKSLKGATMPDGLTRTLRDGKSGIMRC
jgi:Pentapeptide repeats (8 copies)